MDPKKKKNDSLNQSFTKKKASAREKTEEIDTDNSFKRAAEIHDKLQKKIDDMLSQAGITDRDIKNYLDNPSNFSDLELKELNRLRAEYDEKLNKQLGKEYVQKKEVKQVKKSADKLRGKMIGRKRNWIQMD